MNRYLPPEWAPQSAVMLTWPRADGDFRADFPEVEQTFIRIAATISRFQDVHINYGLDPAWLRDRLVQAGAHPARLKVYRAESDDVWARDHGPITVVAEGRLRHLDFTFNGWGGKFNAERDNTLTRRLVDLGAWQAPVDTLAFVLEGGAIETNGAGTLLTTTRCLLSPTRNPGLSRAQIQDALMHYFGVIRVLWLTRGDLIGDDTDGHIDTLARFCNAHTLVYQGCDDPADAHYEELSAMEAEIQAFTRRNGEPYETVSLPLPAAIFDPNGRRLPAGYANFLVINGAVLVPTYGVPQDESALERLGGCFPERQVIGIDCTSLIRQYGSLHCVTMQIPSLP